VDATIEFRRTKSDLDPIRFAIARRLDDLAYGTGVAWGAETSIREVSPSRSSAYCAENEIELTNWARARRDVPRQPTGVERVRQRPLLMLVATLRD
jgi:hypothetical protein